MKQDQICWFLLCGPIPDTQKPHVAYVQVKTAELYAAAGCTILTNFFDPGSMGHTGIPWGECPDQFPFLQEGHEVAALCLKGDPVLLDTLDRLSQQCQERHANLRTFYL